MEEKKFKRTLVTTALPYANGPVHIGHLAGVYVPADIYTRYLRLKGEDVIMIGGSDEHGVPITIKAKAEGVTPQDIVDRYHKIIKDSFEELGISFDIYSRTTSKIHSQMASDFFRKLYDKGEFIEKTSMQYYDEEAHQFLADRYIVGTCPHCGSDHAYGDQCEACGTSLNATDLIEPHSAITGNKPVLKETKHWYLPLDKWEPTLRHWILDEHKEWKPNVYGQCKSWLDMGLQPRAVSRDLDWGVPVPVEGAEGKVLYVWFDAPIGYISNTKELLPDTWETYWKSKDTRIINFIGKDNIVFHCIVFPAMLMADGSYQLPENVPANEFLNLEGDKISTSRNWAVWLHEYLRDMPGKQDVLRYVLTANAPETKDNDFTWKDFQARNNNELVAILGNFVNRTFVLTHKYYKGVVPAIGELTDYDRETLKEFADRLEGVSDFESALHDLIKETIKAHKRIIFNGNGYDDAWVQEAKRRGLANLRDTVDCMPAYIDRKNVELFTRHAILTETEMRARYEIHLENYCKVSAIEASTLLDMVQRHILPAASAYADRLTQTAFHKENSVPALSARMEKTLAQRVTDLGEKLFDTCEALHDALSDAPAADGGIDAARYYRCEIVTRTQKAGELIGRLESLVDAKAWPYPTYADILFSV